jgi:cytosine/creatinine deaminase
VDLIVRGARLRDREDLVDIGIEGDRIVAIEPDIEQSATEEIDAGGNLTTSSFVNPHMHADKSLLARTMRPNESQTLQEAILITWDFKRSYEVEDIVARAGEVVESALRHGTTVMRLFADVDNIGGLTPIEGELETKRRYSHLMDLEVVAFPQEGVIRNPGTEELMRRAMGMGADVVGGLPWYERTDEEARRHVDVVFDIAREFDKDIHMLIDDTDNPNSRSLEYTAVKAIEESYQGRVTASHCGALAAYDDTHAAKVIGLVKEAGISICSNPHISLVLAGRRDKEPIRRGITRVKELLAAGVNVCSGQDDVHDPYYPFGRADQLEVALIASHATHLTYPSELETVFDMVTTNAAQAMRLDWYGLEEGRRADIVVFQAQTLADTLRLQAPRLYVLRKGRVVARSRLESTIAAE